MKIDTSQIRSLETIEKPDGKIHANRVRQAPQPCEEDEGRDQKGYQKPLETHHG